MEGYLQSYISWFPDETATLSILRNVGFEKFDPKKSEFEAVDYLYMPDSILLMEYKQAKALLFDSKNFELDPIPERKARLTPENNDCTIKPKKKVYVIGLQRNEETESCSTPTWEMDRLCEECGEDIPEKEPYLCCNLCLEGFNLCIFCAEVRAASHDHPLDLVEPGVVNSFEEQFEKQMEKEEISSNELDEETKRLKRAELAGEFHENRVLQFRDDLIKGKIEAPSRPKTKLTSPFIDLVPDSTHSHSHSAHSHSAHSTHSSSSSSSSSPSISNKPTISKHELTAVRWLQYQQEKQDKQPKSPSLFARMKQWNLTWGAWAFVSGVGLSAAFLLGKTVMRITQ